MFFRDGKRRIDFVIAYRKGQDDEMKEAKRFAFLNALADQMIEIEVCIIFCEHSLAFPYNMHLFELFLG